MPDQRNTSPYPEVVDYLLQAHHIRYKNPFQHKSLNAIHQYNILILYISEKIAGSFMLLQIQTDRLKLLPFTIQICEEVLSGSTSCLADVGITPANDWPDLETLDTLPRILNNLNKVQSPSGFESWMVLHKSTNILIGDIGFKGAPNEHGEIDLGYGIVQSETQKGYAKEAALGLIEWAFKQVGIKTITANCSKENLASQKILTFLNFTKVEKSQEMIYWKLFK